MSDTETILREVLVEVANNLDYEQSSTVIKPISSDGANYTSELFEVTLSSAGKDDVNLFAKVAIVGEEIRALANGNMFKAEIYVYTQLLKKYKEIEDKYNVPDEHRLATVKLYGANDEYMKETLVMEDLRVKGYEAFDRFKTIDWKYASESLKQLAIFHALSMALPKHDPEEFERTKDILILTHDVQAMKGMMQGIIDKAIGAIKEENKERIAVFIEENMNNTEQFNLYYKQTKHSMLVHGDYRPSNLMHKQSDDGSLTVVPLDYQTCRYGSPLVDLMYFIFSGSDKEFREQHLADCIELYYKELSDALRRLKIDPDEVYPRGQYDCEYKKYLPFGLLISIFLLFIITVEVDRAPKLSKDLNFSDFTLDPNEMYKGRINDIVDDFIKMGVL